VLRSPEPLQPYARCLGEHPERWAVERPGQIHLAQRDGANWRTLTYAETLQRARALATALLQRELSAERPVVILSENSREHALLALAAMHIGAPVVPVVAQDIVVAGHDRDEIRFLIFPNLAGCRGLCPELGEATSVEELLADARVRERVRAGLAQLKAEGRGSSTYATRALFLTEPASIDAGEITDKGYVNQRAVLERRADFVEQLYAASLPEAVITLEG
jgi:long-subunit acyl-CoA synthetase (AMP-forming)